MATKKERPAPQKAPRTAKPAEQSKPAAAEAKAAVPQSKHLSPNSSFGGNARAELSPDEVRKLISEAAYYRAKQRGFTPGHEEEDWIQAEAEVMRRIGAARQSR